MYSGSGLTLVCRILRSKNITRSTLGSTPVRRVSSGLNPPVQNYPRRNKSMAYGRSVPRLSGRPDDCSGSQDDPSGISTYSVAGQIRRAVDLKRNLPNRMRIVIRNLQTEKRALARTRLSGCGQSASEEMQEQQHYPDYQHDVNEAAGNVKGQEPKQPKNNQDRDLMKLNRFKIENQICCMRASANTQASFAFAAVVNAAAFFRTNSCTLSGRCPVSVSTSSDIRSKRPARCRSPIAARWFTT